MNDLTTYDLPNYVQPSSLERLKRKIERAERQMSESDRENGLIVSSSKRRPTSIRLSSLRKRANVASNRPQVFGGFVASDAEPAETTGVNAETAGTSSHISQEESDEDVAFRDSVLHCMFNTLGLEQHVQNEKIHHASVEPSPRVRAVDLGSIGRTHFGSELGNMAMFNFPKHGSDTESEAAFTSNSMEGIESELDNDLEIIHFPKGAVLVEAQERNPGLYYVIDGFLDVGMIASGQPADPIKRPVGRSPRLPGDSSNPFDEEFEDVDDGFKSLHLVKPGGIAGYQAGIGNYRSFIDVRAKTDVLVGFLPRTSLERIMEKKPVVLLTMAKRLISLLSPLILHLDFALEWLQVSAGHTIYRKYKSSLLSKGNN